MNTKFWITRKSEAITTEPSYFRMIGILLVAGMVLSMLRPPAARGETRTMPDHVKLYQGIQYDPAYASCKLDLAVPQDASDKGRPAIIVIHGGGWIEGDKSTFTSLKHWAPGNIIDFAKLGFVAATINYRLSGEAPFPAALEDCKCAVRWLRAHAKKYNIDKNLIGVWGNSAGGHLALMLGMTGNEKKFEGKGPFQDQSSSVQSVVSDSGPTDLDYRKPNNGGLIRVVQKFLAGPKESLEQRMREASPHSYIRADLPPMLLSYGTTDNLVQIEPTDVFVRDMHQAGNKHLTYYRIGNANHCPHSLVRVPWMAQAVDEFFKRTLMGEETWGKK